MISDILASLLTHPLLNLTSFMYVPLGLLSLKHEPFSIVENLDWQNKYYETFLFSTIAWP